MQQEIARCQSNMQILATNSRKSQQERRASQPKKMSILGLSFSADSLSSAKPSRFAAIRAATHLKKHERANNEDRSVEFATSSAEP